MHDRPQRLARRLFHAVLRRCTPAIGCLLLAACGHTGSGSTTPAPTGSNTAVVHPVSPAPSTPATTSLAIPFPDDRSASGLTETIINGKDAEQRSANTAIAGNSLQLGASADYPTYGIYRFNPGGNPTDSINVSFDHDSATAAYIGLANFTTSRWELYGPYSADQTLPLSGGAYTSPSGNLWVAVLTFRSTAAVAALSLRTLGPPNQPPAAAVTASSYSGYVPLSVDFDASGSSDPDGRIIEYAWDWDGDGVYDEFTEFPAATHNFPLTGTYQVKLRVTDDQFAQATAKVTIVVSVTNPPTAATLPVTGGTIPLTINFDGSTSNPNNGGDSIVLYEWDFDGDGIYDQSGSTLSSVSHVYSSVGTFHPTLRVTNLEGLQDTKTGTITAISGTTVSIAGENGDALISPTLALANGKPAVAYIDFGTFPFHLYYSQATDAAGSAWNVPQDLAEVAGNRCCLLVADGRPMICFEGPDPFKLQVIRAEDADGLGWSPPVDPGASYLTPLTMPLINGHPAIAAGYGPDFLIYIPAHDPDGLTWGNPVIVSISTDSLVQAALADVDGCPAMSFGGGADLYYVRAEDSSGSTWNLPVTVDGGMASADCSLAIVGGNPAISYCDYTNGILKFVRSSDVDGTVWPMPVTLGSAKDEGYTQYGLAVINGYPAISYFGTEGLKYIQSTDTLGAGWSAPKLLSPTVGDGGVALLALGSGAPLVCGAADQSPGGSIAFVSGFSP